MEGSGIFGFFFAFVWTRFDMYCSSFRDRTYMWALQYLGSKFVLTQRPFPISYDTRQRPVSPFCLIPASQFCLTCYIGVYDS